jgi:hypothetical protein
LAKDGARNGTPIEYSVQLKDAYRILEETQWQEWDNWYVLKIREGLLRGGAENQTGNETQEHKTIKCRHTHGKQISHNAHIHTKLAGKKCGVIINGVCNLCEEEMGIQHILYTCMKFTRRTLTCYCFDKQIPLKAIYEKGDTSAWKEIIKYLKNIKMDV